MNLTIELDALIRHARVGAAKREDATASTEHVGRRNG